VSGQGIIIILLSTIGVLISSWIAIASMWVRDRLENHGIMLDQHDDRLMELEQRGQLTDDQHEEMLDLLRKEGGV